jgi:DNA polymerase III alpha subunit
MTQLFADFPEAIGNTVEISAELAFELADLGYEFPRFRFGLGRLIVGGTAALSIRLPLGSAVNRARNENDRKARGGGRFPRL